MYNFTVKDLHKCYIHVCKHCSSSSSSSSSSGSGSGSGSGCYDSLLF